MLKRKTHRLKTGKEVRHMSGSNENPENWPDWCKYKMVGRNGTEE